MSTDSGQGRQPTWKNPLAVWGAKGGNYEVPTIRVKDPKSVWDKNTACKVPLYRAGRFKYIHKWRNHGSRLWKRSRWWPTRRTWLLIRGYYNSKSLKAQKLIVDKRPIYWTFALAGLALAPYLQSLVSYYGGFALLVAALFLFRFVDGKRLGRLLKMAPEKREAFAEATEIRDKDFLYFRRFDKMQRDYLKTLVCDEVVEEHKNKPLGQHSEALERLLLYFRRAPQNDKYAIRHNGKTNTYKIVAFSGVRGVSPRLVEDKEYGSVEDAYHGVFLRRIHDLLES